MKKGILCLVGLMTLALLLVHTQTQNDCTAASNTYWTGYRCACKVGFKNQSNICIPLTLLKPKGWVVREPAIVGDDANYTNSTTVIETPNVTHNCYLPFQYYNGQGCVCLDGYARVNGLCQSTGSSSNTPTTCPSNSALIGGVCVCDTGYTKTNGVCVKNIVSGCGANSYDNGLGFCVCNSGYYKLNNACVIGSACPPSSKRNTNGQCICDAGLTKYGDFCAKCPNGAIYDTATQKCIYVCGQNSAYDNTQKKCLCLSGYGIYKNACAKCPSGFFVQNNYCVTCPNDATYSDSSKKCICNDGFSLTAGFCIKKCGPNQQFNSKTSQCDCLTGLGRVNGVCQICPVGTTPIADGTCGKCLNNQRLVDGKCICSAGFIPNAQGVCTKCSEVQGAFLVGLNCATCPGDLAYNSQTNKCSCPSGFTKIGTKCLQTCKNDQLVDEKGLCYSCPIYQVIQDSKCVCQANYVRDTKSGRCQLSCPSGQFKYQGRCAQCPLNLQYRSQIGGCACSDGLYLNTNGVCEKVVLPPISCDAGFFFDSSKGCVSCPAGCKTCTSSIACTSCTQNGFSVLNGTCRTICGDGIIASGQQCDDKNSLSNDGCSSTCQIQTLWNCNGQPSICQYNGPSVCGNGRVQNGQACDDGNTVNGDGCSNRCQIQQRTNNNTNNNGNNGGSNSQKGLSLVGNVNTNINNVFVVLKTDKAYKFANQNQMENFIKTKFPDSTSVPSVYCSQRDQQLSTFDCLAIYSSGIPNQKFNIQFSYNYNGDTGFISVPVDPLASSFATRSTTVNRNNVRP